MWRREAQAGAKALSLPERVKSSGLNKNTLSIPRVVRVVRPV